MNIEKISARLAIEDRAKLDGKFDQPPSTEEGVSGTQREIVAYFKNLQRGAQHQIADLAEELRELGEEIDVSGVNGSVCDIPSRCENEVLRLIAESQSLLNYLGKQETQQQQHYEALHDKSKPDQVAERPISPVFHSVFMAFLIGMGAFAIAKTSVSGFGSASFVPPSWTILISLMIVLENLQRGAQHQIADLAEELRELGEEIDVSGVNGSVCDIPSRCENEVLRLIAESQSLLNYLGKQETQQQQHYEALHDKSKPDQVAERPISPVFHSVFMAFLIGMGAFAIAKTSVSGFGSASFVPPSWTILISLMIVLASFVIARAVSHLIDSVGRFTGWLGGAIGLALIGVMASLAAYYIAAVSTSPGVAWRSVLDSILANPVAIVTDVADWNGFGIVISAGLLAFLVSFRPAI